MYPASTFKNSPNPTVVHRRRVHHQPSWTASTEPLPPFRFPFVRFHRRSTSPCRDPPPSSLTMKFSLPANPVQRRASDNKLMFVGMTGFEWGT